MEPEGGLPLRRHEPGERPDARQRQSLPARLRPGLLGELRNDRSGRRAGDRPRAAPNDVTDDQGTHAQAKQYAAVLATCLRSRTCVSYTTWGVDDRYDWWIDDDGDLQQGHDLLFDEGTRRGLRGNEASIEIFLVGEIDRNTEDYHPFVHGCRGRPAKLVHPSPDEPRPGPADQHGQCSSKTSLVG